ncbi:MAG: DUF3047 domain-containing protein [Desulfocapsa sp.]|nr:DUF3047 domain-containing protein [Desulfocapsa sp.]
MMILLTFTVVLPVQAEEVFLDEQFATLEHWEPFYFPKIEAHSSYDTTTHDGASCLIAASRNSASALLLNEKFNVYEFPNIGWRWKVANVYKKGDNSKKEGDDAPIRLYVMFEYSPDSAPLWKKIKYEVIKLFYGQYPPHSSLNYIWASKKQPLPIIPNPYTSLAMIIPVSSGRESVGNWLKYERNILTDYRAAFGEDPPAMATIGIMSDSDNTGESATAYIDYIRISGK